jgi:hypothetical protein
MLVLVLQSSLLLYYNAYTQDTGHSLIQPLVAAFGIGSEALQCVTLLKKSHLSHDALPCIPLLAAASQLAAAIYC